MARFSQCNVRMRKDVNEAVMKNMMSEVKAHSTIAQMFSSVSSGEVPMQIDDRCCSVFGKSGTPLQRTVEPLQRPRCGSHRYPRSYDAETTPRSMMFNDLFPRSSDAFSALP